MVVDRAINDVIKILFKLGLDNIAFYKAEIRPISQRFFDGGRVQLDPRNVLCFTGVKEVLASDAIVTSDIQQTARRINTFPDSFRPTQGAARMTRMIRRIRRRAAYNGHVRSSCSITPAQRINAPTVAFDG